MSSTFNPLRCFLNESRALLRLAIPIVVTQLAVTGMSFVDTTMAGQFGVHDLAAIAVGTSLWLPASLLLRGILMMLTPVTAHHRGAGEYNKISFDLGQTIWIAMVISALLAVYLNFSEDILLFMNVAPDIIPIGADYLHALAFGLPGIAAFYVLNSFLEGMGNTRAPMVISILGLLVNIPVNYALIYGKFGMPAMGAVGCGWATSLVYWVMSLLMLAYIARHHHYRPLLKKESLQPVMPRIIELFKLGLPIGVNIFVTGSIFAAIALLIGKLGANNIASAQIALNFSGMTYMIPMSISFGITIRVGHALGQNNEAEAKVRALSGIVLAAMMALLSVTALLLFPQQIISLYTNDPDIMHSAAALLSFTAMYQVSDAIQNSTNGALRGYKDTRVPMNLSCFCYWMVALPLGYSLSMTDILRPAMGASGFWVGIIAGLTLAAVVMFIRLLNIMAKPQPAYEAAQG